MLGQQDEAEDATQDALIKAWRSRSSLRDVQDFQGWFDRILVNCCRDRVRRRRRIPFIYIDDGDGFGSSPDEFGRVLNEDQLLRAMSGLDVDLRTVLVMRYWADLTVSEIASRLGWPVGTVKSRIHRALGQMRSSATAPSEQELPA